MICSARIYRQFGDTTMSIVNFTQAIKLNPNDYESYFQRAQMYEKVNKSITSYSYWSFISNRFPCVVNPFKYIFILYMYM